MNPRWHLPILAALATILFVYRLGALDVMPPDEPRYAQVAQEMLHGGGLLAPRLNGEAYKEKPPMLFWAAAHFGYFEGDVGPWAIRLPSALGALATVLFTYALARRLFNADLAFLAALILLTIGRFWWQARVGQIDMLLTAFVTGAIFALYRWHQERRTSDLVLLYAMLACGMLTKGPPALIFPALLAAAFYWRDKPSRKALHWPLGLLAIVLIFLAWLIPARMAMAGQSIAGGSESHAWGEVFKQTVGRFLLGASKAEMPWYYLLNLPKDLLPWTPIALFALPWLWRTRKDSEANRFLWAWVLPAFIFFTISIAKRVTYILPLYPAFAILIALGALHLLSKLGDNARKGIAASAFAVCALMLLVRHIPYFKGVEYFDEIVFLMAITSLMGYTVRGAKVVEGTRLALLTALSTSMVLINAWPVLASNYNQKFSVRDFCAPVAAATNRGEDFDVYSLALFREELLYHGRHPQIEVLMDPLEVENGTSLSSLKAQLDLLTKLRKEVKTINLDNPAVNNMPDQAKLDAWLKGFLDKAKHKEETAALLQALKAELDRFQADFMRDRKAVCFVEERDWRWLRAVEPKLAGWKVVRERKLPDRTLYLLANGGGESLVQ